MNLIKPLKLKKGDTIGILSVSGGISDYCDIEKAEDFFVSLGYKVKISSTTKKHFRYMAGTDYERARELEKFFQDSSVNAILCSRGGYGTLRIIDKINYNVIKENPKIFVGYSDITILLAMIYKKTNLLTFHGPMAKGDFGKDKINEYTVNSFFNTLEGNLKEIKAKDNFEILNGGEAQGILWGGNLASLASLSPVDFVPDKNIILFLEDLNEPVYKLDKMLTQLLYIPQLRERIKGFVFGDFLDNENEEQTRELLKEISSELNVPSCYGFKITHGSEKNTIPFGANVSFYSDEGLLRVENNYLG